MKFKIRWRLVLYDILILALVDLLLLVLYKAPPVLTPIEVLLHFAVAAICIFGARAVGGVYKRVWRYGGIQSYIRLLAVDGIAFWIIYLVNAVIPGLRGLMFSRLLSISCMTLLGTLAIRMCYRYAYKYRNADHLLGKVLRLALLVFAHLKTEEEETPKQKIKVAIIGAGSLGISLAEDLAANMASPYEPCCFIDVNRKKVGKVIAGKPVFAEDEALLQSLEELKVGEVILAISEINEKQKKKIFEFYSGAGFKVKVYDFPLMHSPDAKRHLRSFDIEELLFRKPIVLNNEQISSYYRDKVVLITGGGGSIGSELCRQLAKFAPKTIVILDIYENGAYDVQQELRLIYRESRDVRVEIASITNRRAMAKIFEAYHPQIVINAAAHKHVPLMEHNCVEAVENNVFGAKILVDLCEEYGADRFMMVSTDKAVNPTNVMGATKRMCEMIVQSASTYGKVKYSSTRFGNVLGSAGSVIPLFKKQIANGGPVTLTDKRIIRYFMTIPEAAQLVLQSGAMAKNGELFVLDMGEPVKIYDLAENMIRLSGAKGIEIREVGLRPGEKLYEELLMTDHLEKTENALIFIEREEPPTFEEIQDKLSILHEACDTNDDDAVRDALKAVVPTSKEAKTKEA